MTVYEIPTSGSPKTFGISLAGVQYTLTLHYVDCDQGGWLLDIGDAGNVPVVCGIPLVTGCDLLAQYAYLGFGGGLAVATDGAPTDTPTFTNLGTASHLYFLAA